MNTILMKEFILWNSIVYLLDSPVMEKVIIGIVSGLLLSYTYVKKIVKEIPHFLCFKTK